LAKVLPEGLSVLFLKVITWLETDGPFPVGLPAPDVNSRAGEFCADNLMTDTQKNAAGKRSLKQGKVVFINLSLGSGIYFVNPQIAMKTDLSKRGNKIEISVDFRFASRPDYVVFLGFVRI
jgi:hypothetical protein